MEKLTFTFRAPKGVREFKEIVIREVDGEDELQAHVWAAQKGKADPGAALMELMRASICSVDGEAVNTNGVAFRAFDSWTVRARLAVATCYNAVNAFDEDDMGKALVEGMGPAAPLWAKKQASAEPDAA